MAISVMATPSASAAAARRAVAADTTLRPTTARAITAPVSRATSASVALWVAAAKPTRTTKAQDRRDPVVGAKTMRCSASTARPAKMSVSRMLVSQGSAVAAERSATTPTRSDGRSPSPSSSSRSLSTQIVAATWSTSTGQNSSGAVAASSSP
jgi:hypothetical protein